MKWLFKCKKCGHHWTYDLPRGVRPVKRSGKLVIISGCKVMRQVKCVECKSEELLSKEL